MAATAEMSPMRTFFHLGHSHPGKWVISDLYTGSLGFICWDSPAGRGQEPRLEILWNEKFFHGQILMDRRASELKLHSNLLGRLPFPFFPGILLSRKPPKALGEMAGC